MHGVMGTGRQAEQIPEAVRILGIIFSWPNVMHSCCLHDLAISGRIPTSELVTPQRQRSNSLPPLVRAAVVKACHSHLQGKTKSLHHESRLRYMAQALRHRHNGNIQDGLCSAAFALDGQVPDHRFRQQVGDSTFAAYRTWDRSSVCIYSITRGRIMQYLFGLVRKNFTCCVQ